MTRQVARLLISLYPFSWRARYAEEFDAFLAQRDVGVREIGNILCCAVREHLLLLGELSMTALQRSLVWMCCSCLAAIFAGINLWWSVDDTPLAGAMEQHASISASWNAVEAGSLMMLITAVAAGVPVLFAITRFAWTHHRRDVLVRLFLPALFAATPLVWAVVIGIRLHWLPTPWDVTGDWAAPTSWPPLALRWELTTITTLLLIAAVLVAVMGVRGVVSRSPLSEIESPLPWQSIGTPLSRLIRAGAIPLAASMGLMLVGVVFFGAFSEQYDPGTFHSRAGGLFGSSLVVSWTASVGLFLAACVAGLCAARLSFRPTDEVLRG